MKVDIKYPDISCFSTALPVSDEIKSHYACFLPENLKNSPDNRKDEYIAGRFCALMAAELIGHKIDILPSSHSREPVWPQDLVGSISHSRKLAISCTASKASYLSVGIDTETIMEEATMFATRQMIATRNEISFFDNELKETPHNLKYTLLFSIKESLYKAIYPIEKRFIDFKEVQIQRLSLEDSTFEITYKNNSYSGQFLVIDNSVITILPVHNISGENRVYSSVV